MSVGAKGGSGRSTSPAMAFTSVDHVVVQVFGKSGPPADEWRRFVDFDAAMRDEHGDELRALTLSDGGAPSHEQTAMLIERGVALPLSVVFTSAALRFTVAVITLRVKNMKTFSPSEMPEAFAHLGLRPPTIARVYDALPALSSQIGGSKTVEAVLAARKTR